MADSNPAQPPQELTLLREVLSWAIGVFAEPGTLQAIRDREPSRNPHRLKLKTSKRQVSIDYGDCPTHQQAAWFVRVGLMGTLDQIDNRTKHVKRCVCPCHQGGTGTRGPIDCESDNGCKEQAQFELGPKARLAFVEGHFYNDTLFDAMVKGARIPASVADQLRTVAADQAAKDNGKPDRNGTLPFNKAGVEAAISNASLPDAPSAASSTEGRPARRQAPPAATHATANESLDRVILLLNSAQMAPRIVRKKLALDANGSGGLIATDGSSIAVREDATLRVARVNRASGKTSEWPRPLSLSELGKGAVLAIDSAGSADIAFVWVGAEETAIYRGRHSDGSVELIEMLDSEQASAAVLHGARALLSFPDPETGGGTCDAFPELIVTSLVGVAGDGRLIVLANGTDHDGKEAAWIEVDGRHRERVPAGSRLELPLGTRSVPRLRSANGTVVEVSQQPTETPPYEHWASPFLIGHAATR